MDPAGWLLPAHYCQLLPTRYCQLLPLLLPPQVGEHFSRHDEVVDVVLVRDMHGILQSCRRARN